MLISFFASFTIVFNKNTPEFWKCQDPQGLGMVLKRRLSAGRVMQCRCEFGLLHCSVLDSESMFCFCNESNQKMNQHGWRHFTNVRIYLCRFCIYVKINFQYRKKKKKIPFWFTNLFKMSVCEHKIQNLKGDTVFKYKPLYIVSCLMWRTSREL